MTKFGKHLLFHLQSHAPASLLAQLNNKNKTEQNFCEALTSFRYVHVCIYICKFEI